MLTTEGLRHFSFLLTIDFYFYHRFHFATALPIELRQRYGAVRWKQPQTSLPLFLYTLLTKDVSDRVKALGAIAFDYLRFYLRELASLSPIIGRLVYALARNNQLFAGSS